MRISLFAIVIWVVIPIAAGLLARFAFDSSFWLGVGLALFSLVVNALIIEWEDRQPGGWGNP